MAYTAGFTAITGATFTAAQYNTNVRDNFSAIWAYTTAGDIVYASSATALARLGIGASGKYLKSTGSAPSWADLTTINAVDLALLANLAIPDATYTSINWTSEAYDTNNMHSTVTNKDRVTIRASGWYAIFFQAVWDYSDSGSRVALVRKNGSTIWRDSGQVLVGVSLHQIVSGLEYLVSGDYLTCEVWQNSSISQNLLKYFGAIQGYTRFTVMKVNP